jgi:murein hydrolase activator
LHLKSLKALNNQRPITFFQNFALPGKSGLAGVLFCICTIGFLSAQNVVKTIEQERLMIEREINYTGTLIDKTRDAKSITLNDLAVLQASINGRERLIGVYRSEQERLYDTIFSKLLDINQMSEELKLLKEEYAHMIYAAYRQGGSRQHLLNFFAAENIGQAFNRINWFRAYHSRRKEQIETIALSEKRYLAQVNILEKKAEQNQSILRGIEAETAMLKEEKLLKDQSIAELSKKERELNNKYNQLRDNHEHLRLKIEQALAEEMRHNADGNSGAGEESHERQISEHFKNNLGKLPWPAQFGIVASRFGEHQHPNLKGVKIKNNGINIITSEGSKARAVFDGVVTRVMEVSNFHKVVILRHGEYLTVYSNLAGVLVKRGDKVTAMQDIGTIFTDFENSRTELHFELWQGKVLLDPLPWLTTEQHSVQVQQIPGIP